MDPTEQSWLQQKVQAQRVALHRLNIRVVSQRAVLRKLTELGRELSDSEWEELRVECPKVTDVTTTKNFKEYVASTQTNG